jgi:predicted transcriptional regulator
MEDFLKQALEIVKAQASVRNMTEEEIVSMVKKLSANLQGIIAGEAAVSLEPAIDAKKSIKENSVICLECGKSFKIMTTKHLATHGLTSDEYKAKHGLPKKTKLVAKGLARMRRKKMSEMKLWERRTPKAAKPAPAKKAAKPAKAPAEAK